jgi:hypothetical protein
MLYKTFLKTVVFPADVSGNINFVGWLFMRACTSEN